MKPQDILEQLNSIERNWALGSHSNTQGAKEELDLVVRFLTQLSNQEVAFPAQCATTLVNNLRYLIPKN